MQPYRTLEGSGSVLQSILSVSGDFARVFSSKVQKSPWISKKIKKIKKYSCSGILFFCNRVETIRSTHPGFCVLPPTRHNLNYTLFPSKKSKNMKKQKQKTHKKSSNARKKGKKTCVFWDVKIDVLYSNIRDSFLSQKV